MKQACPPKRIPMLLIALAVGWVSVIGNVPINIIEHPIVISLIFGSLLPMVLAMAWGWQVGLVTATIGLAGMYPVAVWPANGWANPGTCVMLVAWFTAHGWAASWRRSERARWWHNPYVIELVFELLYAGYILTVFRWSFAGNPPPWMATADTEMPFDVAKVIACKSAINGFLVVLLADAALHLAPLRRLLRLPVTDEQRYDGLIVASGMLAGLVLWVADALVGRVMLTGDVSWGELLVPDPRLLVSRLLLVAFGLIGALVTAGLVRRRLRSTRELQESVTRHQQILRTTLDGFWLTDEVGRLLEVNQAYVRMSGYDEQELLTLRIADLDATRSTGEIDDLIRRVQRFGEDRFETRHRRKDGSLYDVEVSAVYQTDDQGGRLFCFLRDISERKQAVEVIELERTLYKDLVAAMPAGVYRCRVRHSDPLREEAWDKRVDITLASEAFCRILGVTQAECEADASIVAKRIHPLDQAEFARLNILGQKTLAPFNSEMRILRDGELRWVHFASLPRSLDNGDVIWTGVLFDTTELRQAEAEQHRLEEQLHQREKMDAIGQLAGGIAHDFNNQLGGILGYADLLLKRVSDPTIKGHVASIHAAAKRAADLTQQLLGFARKGKYRSVATDVHAVIRDVSDMLQRSIDKRITLTLRLEAERCTVQGDPSQLQNVLLNLGLNARDAMPHGGDLTITTTVEDLADQTHEQPALHRPHLVIRIQDTGTGMDAETRRRLFEPFFTTKEVGKGTGLGLASAYGVVKNHGGTLQVWSEPGRGSIFSVILPLVEAPVVVPERTEPVAEPRGGKRILVIDDEPVILAIISDLLEDFGYQVRSCSDPAEAIELYRQQWQDIHLVILDMVMPGMGGKDLFLALRRINPQIKAVLSSGYSLDGETQSILDAGVVAFIQKPFTGASLAETVAKASQA